MTYIPHPTPEGWVGSLNITPDARNALIELLAAAEDLDLSGVEQARRRLESVTGWINHSPSQIDYLNRFRTETLAAMQPVQDWYDGDGEREWVPEMIAEAVKDLQEDRAASMQMFNAILTAHVVLDSICRTLGLTCPSNVTEATRACRDIVDGAKVAP